MRRAANHSPEVLRADLTELREWSEDMARQRTVTPMGLVQFDTQALRMLVGAQTQETLKCVVPCTGRAEGRVGDEGMRDSVTPILCAVLHLMRIVIEFPFQTLTPFSPTFTSSLSQPI